MGRKSKTFRMTFPAILAALGLVFLYISSLLPSGRWAMIAIAGLLPAGAVISVSLGAGFASYAVTGLLGLLLVPSRINALLYLFFFGLYPMVKSVLERKIKNRPLCILCKLVFFNGILTLFAFGFTKLFMPAFPWDVQQHIHLVYLWGSVIFLVYDLGFSKLIAFYIDRVDKIIKR